MFTNEELCGRIIVVKFLRPRNETSDKIGVVGLNMFGYSKSSEIINEVCINFFSYSLTAI